MSDSELAIAIADMLDLVERSDYVCSEDLADELRDELADELTDEQSYAIAEQVEAWWASQD